MEMCAVLQKPINLKMLFCRENSCHGAIVKWNKIVNRNWPGLIFMPELCVLGAGPLDSFYAQWMSMNIMFIISNILLAQHIVINSQQILDVIKHAYLKAAPKQL